MENIGIVLSGGGVRGAAHVGLLKALEENGIYPQLISGSSAGALVGALYAHGYDFPTILDFFKTTPILKLSYYSVSKPGLLNSDKYFQLLHNYFPVDHFNALKKKLFVTVTDIINAQDHIFSEGPLIKTLLASAALPPVFTPVSIEGNLYIDGGIMNNFPVEPLRNKCNKILGSFVNPVRQINQNYLSNSMRVFQRSLELNVYASSRKKFRQCNYVFEPKSFYKYGTFDTRYVDELYQIGYTTAIDQMEEMLRALRERSYLQIRPAQEQTG